MTGPVRILGLDPGSVITGFGIVDYADSQLRVVAFGSIRARGDSLPARLRNIFDELSAIVREYVPQEVAYERLFLNRNVDSALKLGQALGAGLAACFASTTVIQEYAPRLVKQAVVGGGGADKEQVQHMVRLMLQLAETPPPDAADALAVAVCHAHSRALLAPGAVGLPLAARSRRTGRRTGRRR